MGVVKLEPTYAGIRVLILWSSSHFHHYLLHSLALNVILLSGNNILICVYMYMCMP